MNTWRTYLFFACLFAGLFLLRISFLLTNGHEPSILLHVNESVVVSGVVKNDPERRDTSLHAYIEVERIGEEVVEGTLLVTLPRSTELFYGDRVVVEGKITIAEPFKTDTGRMFDYHGYLRVRGVDALMRYAALHEREEGKVSLRKVLFSLKHAFTRSLERLFPEPDASLMQGILIGERRGIPESLNNAFIISGLIHIVVLSGYNIAIVADAILRFLSLFFSRKMALISGAIGILLFAVMTGGGATTVRATSMGLISILARYLERPGAALRALFFAGALMALWNPYSIVDDPSFILSMIATFGLITLSPWVETYLGRVPERGGLRSIAASTIAVQIFILPALLYMTGIFSVFALPANMLALPVVSFAMLGGFLAGIAGIIHPVLALPFILFADALLKWIMLVAVLAASLPQASFVVPAFPLFVTWILYLPLTHFAFRMYNKISSKKAKAFF